MNDDPNTPFAAFLARLGWTQRKMADRLGVEQQRVSGYRRGGLPEPATMFRLVCAFGLTEAFGAILGAEEVARIKTEVEARASPPGSTTTGATPGERTATTKRPRGKGAA